MKPLSGRESIPTLSDIDYGYLKPFFEGEPTSEEQLYRLIQMGVHMADRFADDCDISDIDQEVRQLFATILKAAPNLSLYDFLGCYHSEEKLSEKFGGLRMAELSIEDLLGEEKSPEEVLEILLDNFSGATVDRELLFVRGFEMISPVLSDDLNAKMAKIIRKRLLGEAMKARVEKVLTIEPRDGAEDLEVYQDRLRDNVAAVHLATQVPESPTPGAPTIVPESSLWKFQNDIRQALVEPFSGQRFDYGTGLETRSREERVLDKVLWDDWKRFSGTELGKGIARDLVCPVYILVEDGDFESARAKWIEVTQTARDQISELCLNDPDEVLDFHDSAENIKARLGELINMLYRSTNNEPLQGKWREVTYGLFRKKKPYVSS